MKKILLVKSGILNKEKIKEISENGYVVIETDSFRNVQVLDEFSDINRDVLLHTALTSLDWGNDSTCRNAFGTILRKKLLERN